MDERQRREEAQVTREQLEQIAKGGKVAKAAVGQRYDHYRTAVSQLCHIQAQVLDCSERGHRSGDLREIGASDRP